MKLISLNVLFSEKYSNLLGNILRNFG